MSSQAAWCPFHSTLSNAQTFGPNHPCFTVYYHVTRPVGEPCPSCERDLSYPGQPGHACYTRAESAALEAGS